jgi:Holliday junction resolvase RusA-like endonuclease
MNEIIDAARTNKHVSAAMKKKNTNDVANLLGRRVIFTSPVAIEVEWFEPNAKRDIDNISAGVKFILDALVGRGFIEGDGQKDVVALSNRFHVDAAHPRVEVTVYEVNV